MHIAIIGGSGFIGTRLTKRLLASGHKIKILDKQNSKYYSNLRVFADVRDIDSLKKELSSDFDCVINLAAEHRDDVEPKSLYDEVNVDGAENVCNVCSELEIKKIIFTSSVAVYGFAPLNTNETGAINYFNDYGRTKWLAEGKYRTWLKTDKENSLTIIRPTVVFGEQNRGNVYNLLRQISSGFFPFVGNGKNKKSMAYVENITAFIEFCLNNGTGEHLFNYIDKPDFDMNSLTNEVYKILGNENHKIFHWPYWLGYFGGLCFDLLSKITEKKFAISSIRVKKFCADTLFDSINISKTGFSAPVSLAEGLSNTVKYEFIDKIEDHVFHTE
ncbi:NAD-dependent epimerase/dehydratase family protein [Treponema putidum]|uniref:NAD-dependent epimerase/dehydratase family protein n=1 Tax=Treponema putidum TaxID=221027 RepID=A0ABY5HVS9_9SPIR|nr:NAD-dependent epimerase/dehydratase family protein [Treponema putidum]UTY28333.1 NAD-dependent epimerase/dehydratase family protein [Treponema putidum]UTY30812.1 NAD-dependent epimerase/dehydratase family protein [Treponema putidum]